MIVETYRADPRLRSAQCAPRWPFDTGRAPPGQRGTQEVLAAPGPC